MSASHRQENGNGNGNSDGLKRKDDITIRAFGVEVMANGRTVVGVVIAVAILGAVAFGNYTTIRSLEAHDAKAAKEHEQFINQIKIFTYVLTAPEDERKIIRRRLAVPEELKPAVEEHEQKVRDNR